MDGAGGELFRVRGVIDAAGRAEPCADRRQHLTKLLPSSTLQADEVVPLQDDGVTKQAMKLISDRHRRIERQDERRRPLRIREDARPTRNEALTFLAAQLPGSLEKAVASNPALSASK